MILSRKVSCQQRAYLYVNTRGVTLRYLGNGQLKEVPVSDYTDEQLLEVLNLRQTRIE
jgi:hypothetical protein